MTDWGPNADGTPAEDQLKAFISVITSRGPATLEIRLTEGDARVLATTPPDQLAWMGPVVWEAIVNNIVEAVGSRDHEG